MPTRTPPLLQRPAIRGGGVARCQTTKAHKQTPTRSPGATRWRALRGSKQRATARRQLHAAGPPRPRWAPIARAAAAVRSSAYLGVLVAGSRLPGLGVRVVAVGPGAEDPPGAATPWQATLRSGSIASHQSEGRGWAGGGRGAWHHSPPLPPARPRGQPRSQHGHLMRLSNWECGGPPSRRRERSSDLQTCGLATR
jgi:hypothetical protein